MTPSIAGMASIAMAGLLLSGCAVSTSEVPLEKPAAGSTLDSTIYTTSNGTRIECIYLERGESSGRTGGPACWPLPTGSQQGQPR